MRHLINKHYDTPGGLLGHPTNVSSHPKPPVSLKEDETMKKTKRKAKWEKVLTLTEIKHLRENTDGTLRSVKENFRKQQLMRERNGFNEPCWDCKMIERKLAGGE